MSEAVWRRYRSFLRRPPLLVFRWHDAPTGACGWLVLESLRGGAAGGGTRMRVGLDRREVVYLAKTMELKFAVAGPPIGGAKAGLRFDPQDPRRGDVLRRFYDALVPWLRSRYGTGGDLHIDEVADVLPATRAVGLAHPQEGVLRGHFGLDGPALDAAVDRLRHGLENPVPPPLGPAPGWPAADLVTGYTVARAVREAKAGKVEFRVDKAGNVHVPVGKRSFPAPHLVANVLAVLEAIIRARPAAAKGTYLRSVTLSTTMGPGIPVDPVRTANLFKR